MSLNWWTTQLNMNKIPAVDGVTFVTQNRFHPMIRRLPLVRWRLGGVFPGAGRWKRCISFGGVQRRLLSKPRKTIYFMAKTMKLMWYKPRDYSLTKIMMIYIKFQTEADRPKIRCQSWMIDRVGLRLPLRRCGYKL